ncbi:glycoside hydrolase family 26 protein [Kitasatospora sp. NPDC088783]|uniref:glycoside hydrolase family 26 protein n=1 Tax=Kitasatospora sp. NPDC088783 TaxID=3364077 RepID=UPI00380907CF
MTGKISRRRLMLTAAAAAVTAACSPSPTAPIGAGGIGAEPGKPGAEGVTAAPRLPYDVSQLLKPARKYLGATFDGVPKTLDPVDAWAELVGKEPNLLVYYLGWGDEFQTDQTAAVWKRGLIPYIAWEPFRISLADIAAGQDDEYVRRTALAIRDLNVPVAISFAHEMNGHWYPWGTKQSTAQDFVKAWRHLHDVFQDNGVSNVIWVWSPNVINPVPNVRLQPYYPGDGYVDWLGVVGYYAKTGPHTFGTLFGPTLKEIRAFTSRPVLLAETASEPTPRKSADIADLFAGVFADQDIVGFVWFDLRKESDWRVDSSPESLAAFRHAVADPRIGFDVEHPDEHP